MPRQIRHATTLSDPASRVVVSGATLPRPRRPASLRLARVVVAASCHPDDWRSLEALAAIVGVGYGTLRAWCRSAGVSGRSFDRFCRVFRAVHVASQTGARPADLLDVVEVDTLNSLFRAAGIEQSGTDLDLLCSRQAILPTNTDIAEVALELLRAP